MPPTGNEAVRSGKSPLIDLHDHESDDDDAGSQHAVTSSQMAQNAWFDGLPRNAQSSRLQRSRSMSGPMTDAPMRSPTSGATPAWYVGPASPSLLFAPRGAYMEEVPDESFSRRTGGRPRMNAPRPFMQSEYMPLRAESDDGFGVDDMLREPPMHFHGTPTRSTTPTTDFDGQSHTSGTTSTQNGRWSDDAFQQNPGMQRPGFQQPGMRRIDRARGPWASRFRPWQNSIQGGFGVVSMMAETFISVIQSIAQIFKQWGDAMVSLTRH